MTRRTRFHLAPLAMGIRWLCVLPATYAAWWFAAAAGFLLHAVVDAQCPPTLVVSSVCTAWWMPAATRGIMVFTAALAAALVVGAAVATAPARRRAVAWITFGVGAIVATVMALAAQASLEWVAAVCGGWSTTRFVTRRLAP